MAVVVIVGIGALAACPQSSGAGDPLGTFHFSVVLQDAGCAFLVLDGGDPSQGGKVDPAPFDGTLSSDRNSSKVWLTSGATKLEGTRTGNEIIFQADASRDLPKRPLDTGVEDGGFECGEPGKVTETLRVTLFAEALSECPTEDAGTVAPVASDAGVDFRTLCGYLTEEYAPLDTPDARPCAACSETYRIIAKRQ